MYFAIRNFKHSGKVCNVGQEYKGDDIKFLLQERLIEERIYTVSPEPEPEPEKVLRPRRGRPPKEQDEI